MTEVQKPKLIAPPPWEPPEFFTDAALKAAQEYYFQTHATHSKLIAEGRNAVGFMKSHIRRKLQREMGEDFRMYTGQVIGESDDKKEVSMGIRGELNQLLETIYRKISPGTPIQSPIQEDLTILKHPLGGLEVCYCLIFFYTSLMQRYATLAGNRRKVLKSILDEELFKWVWRMAIAFLLMTDENKFDFRNSILSTGVNYIPADKQRATSAEKVLEIGQFLLGKVLAESHMRFPLVFYFATFCRYLQFTRLCGMQAAECEAIYKNAITHKHGDAVSDVLVAIDELMNTTGNSGQGFEEVLKDEEMEVENYIPPMEIEFISQFREFTRANMMSSLKKIIPARRPGADDDVAASLMPLLLMLRTLPFDQTKIVLHKVPGPYLLLLNNRIGHGEKDDVSHDLLNLIKSVMEDRTKSGETYTLAVRHASGKKSAMQTVKSSTSLPASPAEGTAQKVEASPAATESTVSAPAPETKPAASIGSMAATAEQPAAPRSDDTVNEPVVLNWHITGSKVAMETLTASELMVIAGPEARIVFQLIKFAMQTGQVFHLSQSKMSKESMNQLISKVLKQGPGDQTPLLSKEQRIAIIESGKKLSAKQLLGSILDKFGAGSTGPTRRMEGALNSLTGKLGETLEAFLRNPNQENFREIVKGLSRDERETVSILNRVSRLT